MGIRQTEEKITALYERLSRDDDQMGDSNSILTQKTMLEGYAAQHGFTNCQHYTDDGWSGGNFDRPGWKRLVQDIEAGKIGAVLAKDMSRIGRDYLQTGFYTEVFFRQYDVRFVAISNGVDSADVNSSEFAPFLNIMNEWYLRDQSRKVGAACQVKGKSGKPLTGNPIYGYRKDPDDKDHWLIDEEPAAVVRRIYKLAAEGHGPWEIARMLKDDQVESPGYYMAKHGRGNMQTIMDMTRPHDWYGNTVSTMLAKPEYMGHTVNFRSYKKHYKDKRRIKSAPEDWMIFENTHEAIVDPDTWKLAQSCKKAVHRKTAIGTVNPLTGLVYCADCGARMHNHRGTSTHANGKSYYNDFYNCSTYSHTRERETALCFSHFIKTDVLNELLLESIRLICSYAIESEEEFIQKVHAASMVQQEQSAKELKRKIAKAKKRSAELDVLLQKLYESFALGKMPEKRYETLSAAYEAEQAELESTLAMDVEQLTTFEADTDNANRFLALAKRYVGFEELTPAILNSFIDKIMVHGPDYTTGERILDVEIYFQFIGRFDIPAPELTPEEQAEQERRRQQRIKDHHYYLLRKERNKKRAAEKAAQENK